MAEQQQRVFPDSTNKWPTTFSNLLSSQAYPKWEPIDTAKQTKQVFKFGFYTTAGAYAWLYLWKRTTFKLELPMVVTGFATVAVAGRGIAANLRETNDGWNTFWGVLAGNAAVLTAGFRSMPLKQKLMTGISGACLTALAEQIMWLNLRLLRPKTHGLLPPTPTRSCPSRNSGTCGREDHCRKPSTPWVSAEASSSHKHFPYP